MEDNNEEIGSMEHLDVPLEKEEMDLSQIHQSDEIFYDQ